MLIATEFRKRKEKKYYVVYNLIPVKNTQCVLRVSLK